MEIRINGKRAALKKGSSIEFVAENRLFSGSDGYTLSVTFPLIGCPDNLAIFGHINRADIVAGKAMFDCEIRDKGFSKFGTITINEINDAEVKTQFLEGRSEQNFDSSFDKLYINDLTLGTPPSSKAKDVTPQQAWTPNHSNPTCVALPWVNNTSGNIQNLADYNAASDSYAWNAECAGLSFQPYLLFLTKLICNAVGYTFDFSKWEAKEEYKYLLVCNTLPHAWDMAEFARALPHWSVAEYFQKLELFLGGEFDINHRDQTIKFDFSADMLAALPPVQLSDIIDEHSVELSEEDDKCEYHEAKNIVYKECDHEMWKFYSCDWFVQGQQRNVVRYASLSELLAANKDLKEWNGHTHRGDSSTNIDKLLYAEDVDAYFIVRSLSKELVQKQEGRVLNSYKYRMELRPLNLFGGRIVDKRDDAGEVEIEFVPAWIDETEQKYGRLLFLPFAGYDETDSTNTSFYADPEQRKKEIDNTLYQPQSVYTLTAGEETKKAEYYDRIYVAWWDGTVPLDGTLPHPYAENIEIQSDWENFRHVHVSLRLNSRHNCSRSSLHAINTRQKMTFKFLADSIPNPRSVFFICGKRYLCEKLTATFTENGMSQLIKGLFWPIKD